MGGVCVKEFRLMHKQERFIIELRGHPPITKSKLLENFIAAVKYNCRIDNIPLDTAVKWHQEVSGWLDDYRLGPKVYKLEKREVIVYRISQEYINTGSQECTFYLSVTGGYPNADPLYSCIVAVFKYLLQSKGHEYTREMLNWWGSEIGERERRKQQEEIQRIAYIAYLDRMDSMIRDNRNMPDDVTYWTILSKGSLFFSIGRHSRKFILCLVDDRVEVEQTFLSIANRIDGTR